MPQVIRTDNTVTESRITREVTVEGTLLTTNVSGAIWTAWNTTYDTSTMPVTMTITNTTTNISTVAPASSFIWNIWNQTYVVTSGTVHVNHRPIETPEQIAQREQFEQARRQEMSRIELARNTANNKAEKLLLEHLTPKQREELASKGHFHIVTPASRIYRIRRGRSRNVQQVDASGRVLRTLCAHPGEYVPDADTMLAQALMLGIAEEEFLRIANHS